MFPHLNPLLAGEEEAVDLDASHVEDFAIARARTWHCSERGVGFHPLSREERVRVRPTTG
jgi:hypothetical protein